MITKLTAMAADIDGTLVNKGEAMMPKTKAAITRLHEEGVLVGISTGRAISSGLFSRAESWGLDFQFDFLIGINGGQLWDRFHDGIEKYYLLSTETMKEIMDMMHPLDLPAQIYEGDTMVVTKVDPMIAASMARNKTEVVDAKGDESRIYIQPNNNIIFRYEEDKEEEVMSFIAALPSDRYTAVKTSPGIVEFMDPRVDKGVGIRRFAERNNIPISEIMAFGDMDNDEAMLREAGWGVCLVNGSAPSKAAADAVTEYPCTEDGMGRYLYRHWFHEE